jgi:plasmid maintenance system antidote protein VapI
VFNPPHPGLTLRDDILPALNLQVGQAADVWLAQQAAYDLWQARAAAKASKTLLGIKALRLQTA